MHVCTTFGSFFPTSKYVILSVVLIAIEILSNPPVKYANT